MTFNVLLRFNGGNGKKERGSMMKYRILGRTSLKVSEIALGCEGFLKQDDAFAQAMFRRALNAGGLRPNGERAGTLPAGGPDGH